MYIPTHSVSLDTMEMQQIRLGIQGPPGEGKTYAALTFPNVIVYNLNKGLGAHRGKSNIIEIQIWNPLWVKEHYPTFYDAKCVNRRDLTIHWLNTEGIKLEESQTLVIDALGDLEAAHNKYERENPTYTKSGKLDEFADWRNKIAFFEEFDAALKSLRCHVVLISHETKDREQGALTGKLRPLLTGQVSDKIAGYCTDWFRQIARDKLPREKVDDRILAMFKMTREQFMNWQDTFPRNTIYVWQTESDDLFSGKCSSLVDFPRYIPATFESFIQYLRE